MGIAVIRAAIWILFAMGAVCPAGASSDLSASAAVVIVGLGGDKAHYDVLVESGKSIAQGLRDRFGYGDNVFLLTEDGKTDASVDGRSDAVEIRARFAGLTARASSDDRLLIVLIGHANGDASHWRLNIPGEDLSAVDWRQIISPFPGRVAVIAAAPRAAFLSRELRGPNRVILASTRVREIRTWAFLKSLVNAIGSFDGAATRPKTVWDLFEFSEEDVKSAFFKQGYMRNEHASLEDDGDGLGTEAGHPDGKDGMLARGFVLKASSAAASDGSAPSLAVGRGTLPPDIDTLASTGGGALDPADFDAMVLLREEDVDIDDDLSSRWRSRQVIKIISESGRSRADLDYSFPPGVSAEIVRARTILPDGRILDADTHAVLRGIVLDGQTDTALPGGGSPLPRSLQLHLSEAVPGSTLEVELKITTRDFDIQGDFFHDFVLQQDIPVRRMRVRIRYPKRLNFRIVSTYQGAGRVIQSGPAVDAGRYAKKYEYEVENLEAIVDEPLADPAHLRSGRLVVSSVKTWNEIAKWYHFLSRPVLKADGEIQALAKRLTKDKPSPEEKIRALYEWVSEEIRYVAIPLGVHGYKPHMVPNIYKRRYGDCKDKASLLITLLREVGIKSQMVLIGAGMGNVVPEVPRPSAFNHAIVALPAPGGVLFMDPTAENCMFGTLPPMDQGRHGLIVWGETGALEITPVDPPETNALSVDRQIRIEGTDLVVGETRVSAGVWALKRRGILRGRGVAEGRSIVTEKYGREGSGFQLVSYRADGMDEVNRPLTEALEYRLIGAAAGVLILPWEPSPLRSLLSGKDRAADISLGTTFLLSERADVIGVSAEASEVRIRNSAGAAVMEVSPGPARFEIRRTIRLEKAGFSRAEWPLLVTLAKVVPPILTTQGAASTPSGVSKGAFIAVAVVAAVSLVLVVILLLRRKSVENGK